MKRLELIKRDDGLRVSVSADKVNFVSEKALLDPDGGESAAYCTLAFDGGEFVDIDENYDVVCDLIYKKRCRD